MRVEGATDYHALTERALHLVIALINAAAVLRVLLLLLLLHVLCARRQRTVHVEAAAH